MEQVQSPQRLEDLQLVYELTSVLARAREIGEIYEVALEVLKRGLGADRASILLFDDDGVLRFKAWRGLSATYRRAVEGHSPWTRDAVDPPPVLVPDVEKDEALAAFAPIILGEGIRALGFIPLIAQNQLVGKFMIYYDAPRVLAERELQLARTIADHVAFGVHKKRADDELALYREIFAQSTDGIGVIGSDGKYLLQNEAHRALLGYSEAELRAATPALHMGQETFDRVRDALVGSGVFEGEISSRTGDGRRVDVELSAFAVASDPPVFVGISRDVTERRRSEDALRFLAEASAVLDQSLDYVTTLQNVARLVVPLLADWCLVDVIDELGNIKRLAIAHRDPARLPILETLRDEYAPDWRSKQPSVQVLETGKPLHLEELTPELVRRHSRDTRNFELISALETRTTLIVPLNARGRTLGALVLSMAESGRFYDEGARALATDLARRAALAIDNARLYREAQDSDRRKDEFLAMLAHELRNPLAPISAAMQLMELSPDDKDVLRRSREVIERQVRHLTRLVNDLLDVSRITRGKIELRKERVQLATAVKQVVDGLRSITAARRHTIDLDVPEHLHLVVDPLRLDQILSNLLSNACKYTETGGHISIRATREEEQVRITVRDDGLGISEELLPRIFDLFMQGSRSLDRSLGGLGIGLTLVRSLAQLHGGTVTASSEGTGKGSEFVVTLPIGRLSEVDATPAPLRALGLSRNSASKERRRVLVVDDNLDAATVLAEAIAADGHHVRVAYDGPSAIEAALHELPDLIVLDIGLPGMDGFEVARQLRGKPELSATTLVALSGYGRPSDKRHAAEVGFTRYFVKPLEISQIDELLSSRQG